MEEIKMAKKNIALQLTNAELTVEDGQYILTETTKEEVKSYSLSSFLDSLVGQGISLNLKNTKDIESIE